MTESRPPLTSSISFPADADANTSSATTVDRPLKRSFTSSELFTPAATSFNPRPYTPSSNHPPQLRNRAVMNRNRIDPHGLVATEPSLNDPNVLFIHPPFTNFPHSESYPGGLTFTILTENPEWFLDPKDFLTIDHPNPSPDTRLVAYPTILEPPRGWCPAKKKDLKDRGSEGWPEGEEPRLRCTFCRRTYAGVNAKSMWRRHVFEKHKIAMANRREGVDRPRGRGSTKENRLPAHKDHDSLMSIEVGPQSLLQPGVHRSKFRSHVLDGGAQGNDNGGPSTAATNDSAPQNPFTPPLTPHKFFSSDPASSDELECPSSPPILPIIPASPYNPLSTPNWRIEDAPPRPPSPWRYRSPSNRARELSLSLLAPDLDSPAPVLVKQKGVVKKTPFANLQTPESMAKYQFSSKYSTPSRFHEESPLAAVSRHRKSTTELSDDWLTGLPRMLSGSDPFVSLWDDSQGVVTESPIIRGTKTGPGAGLLEPFILSSNNRTGPSTSSGSDPEEEDRVENDLTESSPPLKRRKTNPT